MSSKNPAIVCLGYNRPKSLERLLKSIGESSFDDDDITLVVSIDECELSNEVEKVAKDFDWKYGNKVIKRYKKRLGTFAHAIMCGDMTEEYGAIIYLEDDIVVAPGFYKFVKASLSKYSKNKNFFGVALYSIKWIFQNNCGFNPYQNGSDVYKFSGDISWGQCWEKKSWTSFKKWLISGKYNDELSNSKVPLDIYAWPYKSSWSRAISFFMAENNMYYIVPYNSLSTCMADKGVHTSASSDICQVPISYKVDNNYTLFNEDDLVLYDQFYESNVLNNIFENVCVDLNGLKYDYSGYKYILTSKKLEEKIVNSYSDSLEPIEANILNNLYGNKLFLYENSGIYNKDELKKIVLKRKNNYKSQRIFYKFSIKELVEIMWQRIVAKIDNVYSTYKK